MDAENDDRWRIGLISTWTGATVGKLSFSYPVTERRMRWHPDGKFIGQILYSGENINLLLLPINGGQSAIISGLGKGAVNWFEWSSDGTRIVIASKSETQDIVYFSK